MKNVLQKLQIKGYLVGFLTCLMLFGTTLVFGSTRGGVMRELFYNVNVVVDGVPQSFEENMQPFIAGGRAFLPVRGIADVFGLNADWDSSTNTVFLWSGIPPIAEDESTVHEEIVARADGNDVPAGLVLYRVEQARAELETEGVSADNNTVLEKAVQLSALYALVAGYAEEHGITLTSDDLNDIQHEIDDAFSWYSSAEDFLKDLAGHGIHGINHFRQLLINAQIMDKVLSTILETPELFSEFEPYMEPEQEEELLAAKHILIRTGDFDDEDTAMEFAEGIWERAIGGEDFDALVETYGQDPGIAANPEGYTFTSGVMVIQFENATKALEIGEISEPFVTQHGIHIVLRIEPNPDTAMRPWGTNPPTLEDRQTDAVVSAFEQRAENAVLEFLPALYEILNSLLV
jgi:parvulin-like peptidyl-prolyl isomerase